LVLGSTALPLSVTGTPHSLDMLGPALATGGRLATLTLNVHIDEQMRVMLAHAGFVDIQVSGENGPLAATRVRQQGELIRGRAPARRASVPVAARWLR
jgi:hypothetical protein